VPGPVASSFQGRDGYLRDVRRGRRFDAEQDDPCRREQAPAEGKFAEVFIECDQKPTVRSGTIDTWESLLPGDSVRIQKTSCPRARSASTAALGKFRWQGFASVNTNGVDLFRMEHDASVGQASQNVLAGYTRIVCEYLSLAPTLGEEIDDKLHR
jgi:hypothetical protein